MNQKSFYVWAVAASACLAACSQKQPQQQAPEVQSMIQEPTVFANDDVEIHQIDSHTWHGNGHLMFNESIYLIEGDNAAMLIDAGTKMPGLKQIVEDIVKKPVSLYASHVHPDHTGIAINEWDTLWLNAADTVNIPGKVEDYYQGTVMYLTDGQQIDLGNRTIEVVFTPGHTPGSTTFIDKAAHYGFSADAFGSGNLLVFTDLSTEITTCQRMDSVIKANQLTVLYPGHYWGNNLESPQRVLDVATLCQDALNGTREPVSGTNKNLPYVVEDFGVKINYGDAQKK